MTSGPGRSVSDFFETLSCKSLASVNNMFWLEIYDKANKRIKKWKLLFLFHHYLHFRRVFENIRENISKRRAEDPGRKISVSKFSNQWQMSNLSNEKNIWQVADAPFTPPPPPLMSWCLMLGAIHLKTWLALLDEHKLVVCNVLVPYSPCLLWS